MTYSGQERCNILQACSLFTRGTILLCLVLIVCCHPCMTCCKGDPLCLWIICHQVEWPTYAESARKVSRAALSTSIEVVLKNVLAQERVQHITIVSLLIYQLLHKCKLCQCSKFTLV